MDPAPIYKRILLKISGEAFKGEQQFGISEKVLNQICDEIKKIHDKGVEIATVIGGGNFIRGSRIKSSDIDRASADYMGMLATVINGIALQNILEKKGLSTRLVSALEIRTIAEPYIRRRAIRHIEKGRVVIFSAGTGSPFFSTDTAASLRAIEIKANILLKGTLVDGVFNDDPKKVKSAQKYETISYMDVLNQGLKVIDSTAVSLCKENNLPIKIFNITKPGNIYQSIHDPHMGTTIS